MIDPKIVQQVAADEGFIPTVYRDSEGFNTIGFGFLVDHRRGGGLTREEAEVILKMRLEKLAYQLLPQRIPWYLKLDPVRQGVLVNMAYNLGVEGLLKFKKFLAAMKAGDYLAAVLHMENSKWYQQVKGRAKRLQKQVLTGEWQ